MILVFFAVLLTTIFLLNLSIYYPVAKSYGLSNKARKTLVLLLGLMTLLMVGGEVVRRVWGIYWLSTVGFVIMGVYSITFTLMIISITIFLISKLLSPVLPSSPKSVFQAVTTLSLILSVILSIIALWNGNRIPIVVSYQITSDKIGEHNEGLRIVFASDFHLTGATNIKRLYHKFKLINELNPDLIIIGGDLIDEPLSSIKELTEPFRKLEPAYGIYAVSGNHEYYTAIKDFATFADKANIRTLFNENIRLTEGLTIIGVPDPTAKAMGYEGPDIPKAFTGVNEDDFLIFVSHQPIHHQEAAASDLMLAGHTHKGQIPPMTWLVALYYKYHYSLFKPEPGKYIYTTSGISTWGPPMRLLSNNEIVLFTLTKEH